MSVLDRRAEAVAETVAKVRAIESAKGVSQAALAEIKTVLIDLAQRGELFPPEHFPVRNGSGAIYRLAEDSDQRFALYASAGVPGKAQPPHNHTTWAVIAGVFGDEHNVFYERIDDRGTAGTGAIRKTGELTVRRGNAVGFLPDDFHTIEVTSADPSLHLHMYGMSLENLPERIYFAGSTGGAYKVFPASPNIVTALVPARELKAMLNDGDELALIDVREEGEFGKSHLLFASCVPVSRLEMRIDALVPRRTTRIVLCDADDGLGAARGDPPHASSAITISPSSTAAIEAWRAEGFELFSGVNVPSKAFGEFVEHHDDTPRLPAEEIKAQARCRRGHGDPRQPAAHRIPRDEHPGRRRLPRRRAGLSRARRGALARYAGRRQLRRAHAQHHRRAIADQCRHPEPRGRAQGRHDGLASCRARSSRRARPSTPRSRRAAGSIKAQEAAARVAKRFGVQRIDSADARPLRGASARSARSMSSTCARPTNTPRATSPARARRPAASSSRRPTPMSGRATRASCWSTMTACAPR